MKSWQREVHTHLAIIRTFLDLAQLPETEAGTIRQELERYLSVRLDRKLWMHPEITRFHTEWYREFYRIAKVADPYKQLKEASNVRATEVLQTLDLNTLRKAVLASIVANRMDFGAVDPRISPLALHPDDFHHVPVLFDDFFLLDQAVRNAKRILYLVDNHGEVLFDKTVMQRIKELNTGCEIFIGAKESPMLNDVTCEEALQLGLHPLGRVVSTGSNCFGVPEDEVSETFLSVMKTADVIIAKGQAYFEFWLNYDVPNVFNLVHTKVPIADDFLGRIPAGSNLIVSSPRYRHGKRPYKYPEESETE